MNEPRLSTSGPRQMTQFFAQFFSPHVISKMSIVEHVWPNDSIFSSIFCRVKNRVKNRVALSGPYGMA